MTFILTLTFSCQQETVQLEETGTGDEGLKALELTAADGSRLYEQNCLACHGDLENSAKKGKSELAIRIALENVQAMSGLKGKFTPEEIAVLSEALKLTPSSSEPSPVNVGGTTFIGNSARGAELFRNRNCIGCHTGSLYDQIRGATLTSFNIAITEPSTNMGSYFDLSTQEKVDIVEYLKNLPVGGGDPSAARAAFRDSVYQITSSNSCVNCHGSGLLAHGSNNLTEAYNAAIGLVNFADMPNSKMVRTMRGENPEVAGHQVFSDQAVIQMQAAINQWKEFEAPDGTQNASTAMKAFRDSVYVVTRSNCLGCHRAGGRSRHASDNLTEAYNQALQYINFNDPSNSVLRTKALGPGHGGGAYPQAAAELNAAIEYWRGAEEAN